MQITIAGLAGKLTMSCPKMIIIIILMMRRKIINTMTHLQNVFVETKAADKYSEVQKQLLNRYFYMMHHCSVNQTLHLCLYLLGYF